MFVSVKARFTLLHFIMILGVALVLGISSYELMINALQKHEELSLRYLATSNAELLDMQISNKETQLQQLALNQIVLRYSESFQDKLLQEYFSQYAEEFSSLSFIDQQGFEQLRVENGVSIAELDDISRSRLFEEISWQTNQVFTTLSDLDASTNSAQLITGYYRENFFGDFEGAVVGRSELSTLMRRFENFRHGENGFLMVLDDVGNVLTHPTKGAILKTVTFDGNDSEQLILAALDMQTGVGRANILGVDGFVGYAPVKNRNWTMLATLPYSEFISEPQRYKKLFLWLLLAILLAAILLSLYMATAITRPILRLTQSSDEIARGDLSQRVRIHSTDEIGQLGESFNMMVNSLQDSKKELDAETRIRESLINELESKYAELERFSYTVSHDLKSPLVTVKGFIGLLKEDIREQNPLRIDQDLKQIENAANKMVNLLEDLLELSRVGRVVNGSEAVALSGLFEEASQMLHSKIKDSGAQLSIQPDMPQVFADRQRMFEVAQNLLENGLKFHLPSQAPEISVYAQVVDDKVTCCVRDHGIGIEPEYHDRIFGLFNRLDESYDGTGIGLALVKRIIEVHNGTITVKSKGDGSGAEFCFTLPVVHQEKNSHGQ